MPAHVLAAAAYWGYLEALYIDARQRLDALQRAQLDGLSIPDEELQAISEAFRRAHGLRTVQATETWMAARGVTVDDFTDFLEREALRARMGKLPGPPARRHPSQDAAAVAKLWPDAVFTGLSDDWCLRLAARAAAAREVAEDAGVPASLFDTGSGGAAEEMRLWLESFGLNTNWYERLRALESAHAYFAAYVQTPARLDAAMRARWSTLFAIDVDLGAFATEAAAREACLCVTEDGISIREVCAMAGGEFQRGRILLGDLPGAVRTHALSVPEASILPVFDWDGRHIVCCVRGKAEPSLDEPGVRETVSRVVLEEALQPLVQRHVTWPRRALE